MSTTFPACPSCKGIDSVRTVQAVNRDGFATEKWVEPSQTIVDGQIYSGTITKSETKQSPLSQLLDPPKSPPKSKPSSKEERMGWGIVILTISIILALIGLFILIVGEMTFNSICLSIGGLVGIVLGIGSIKARKSADTDLQDYEQSLINFEKVKQIYYQSYYCARCDVIYFNNRSHSLQSFSRLMKTLNNSDLTDYLN